MSINPPLCVVQSNGRLLRLQRSGVFLECTTRVRSPLVRERGPYAHKEKTEIEQSKRKQDECAHA